MHSGRGDEMKGRMKETAGMLVGDGNLEREGRIDRLAGKGQGRCRKVIDKAKGLTKGR